MTTLKILQGSGQIGGNIVLIEGEKSRLILDFGIPLTDIDGTPADIKLQTNNMPCPLETSQDKETIAFLSHAHPDHFGLLNKLDKSIPIYATKITIDLIKKTSGLLYDNLFDDLNMFEFSAPVETEDFIVKCYSVNHSVAGSCAFEITDKLSGKTVLYSGDLRAHGRGINEIVEMCKNPDYLILEGTTLSRSDKKTKTEQDIEKEMADIFSEKKMSIVCCSPLNKDRMTSLHQACNNTGKTLVIDPYTAYILDTFEEFSSVNYKDENIKVYCAPNGQTKKVYQNKAYERFCGINKISFKTIMKNPEKYVIKENFNITKSILKRMSVDNINIIYSYWEGYLEDEKYRWHNYIDKLKLIHTSGHIAKEDLIKLVKDLNPTNIIPIHTLSNNKFKELFKSNTLELENGQVLSL